MARIAFIMLDLPDLSGGGGAERFFADFFETYRQQAHPEHELFLITDNPSNLMKAGFLTQRNRGLIEIRNFRHVKYSSIGWMNKWASRWFGNYLLAREIKAMLRYHQIKLVHIPLYERRDYFLYRSIDRMDANERPKLVLNVVDCRIPEDYFLNTFPNSGSKHYGRFFKNVQLNGIFSWYENFKEFARKNKLVHPETIIESITSRYAAGIAEPMTTIPEKKKVIVWASRMDKQKDPFYFLEALKILKSDVPENEWNGWRIEMNGKGPLKPEIEKYLKESKLESLVHLKENVMMKNVFQYSSVYVSTQCYENFPSLAMAEAMMLGNAIIAKDVGQTKLFVHQAENGLLCREGSPDSLADCLKEIIKADGNQLKKWGVESIRLSREVHSRENFFPQANAFWNKVLASN